MGSVVRKITKPIRKVAKKIIPKEIKPFLPYAAAAFGAPYLSGSAFMKSGVGNAVLRNAISKGLISGATAAATDDDANILRSATLAAAPDLLQGGLGAAGSRLTGTINKVDEFAPTLSQDVGKLLTKAADSNIVNLAANPTQGSGLKKLMNVGKVAGAQASIDQAAKLAEINQAEIDKYNEDLRNQGVLDKTKRRSSIYNIYINAGYEPDYVNSMLDRYGYAEGGIMKATSARMSLKDFAKEIREKQKKKKDKKASGGRVGFDKGGRAEIITGLLNIKDADGNLIYSYEEAVDKANELLPDQIDPTDLQSAAQGIEAAFGRSFGNVEPVPMLRFAKGGEVEIDEEIDDLNIMDFMKDQGIPYGEQASYGYDEAMSDSFDMFQDYKKRGLIPMEMEFDEFLEIMRDSKKSQDGIMRMAKSDMEEMYEQYVFEMEEMGLEPMSFSDFLRQARSGMANGGITQAKPKKISMEAGQESTMEEIYFDLLAKGMSPEAASKKAKELYLDMPDGMADGGKVKRRKKGEPADEIIETEQEIFIDTMPRPKRQGIMEAADGGIMEKDMRGGGFIPEGSKERADDVPARLSKNEFVMTADAVRAAGGGSVNKGAKRMYDMMYQLEGKV